MCVCVSVCGCVLGNIYICVYICIGEKMILSASNIYIYIYICIYIIYIICKYEIPSSTSRVPTSLNFNIVNKLELIKSIITHTGYYR